MMLMMPPDTLNSNRSPDLMPTCLRTLRGTTKSFLLFTVIVMAWIHYAFRSAFTRERSNCQPCFSAARTRAGVNGYSRIRTPVASKNAFPIAPAAAAITSSPAPDDL